MSNLVAYEQDRRHHQIQVLKTASALIRPRDRDSSLESVACSFGQNMPEVAASAIVRPEDLERSQESRPLTSVQAESATGSWMRFGSRRPYFSPRRA